MEFKEWFKTYKWYILVGFVVLAVLFGGDGSVVSGDGSIIGMDK